MNFAGKVAIVTGGAQGIGRAYCTALLDIGMKVCICDIKGDTAEEFIKSLPREHKSNVMFQRGDVTSFTELKDVFDKVLSTFGRIDLVVNNAGTCNEHDWKKVIDINFIGVIHGIQLALEYMGVNKGGNGGNVINTASQAGLKSTQFSPIYSGTKHAVVGLTKSYGTDYHFNRTGVKVNAICPGPVYTDLLSRFPQISFDEEEAEKYISGLSPIKAEEVAKALIQILEDGRNGALLGVDIEGRRYEG